MEVRKDQVERVMRDVIEVLDYVEELKDPEDMKKYVFYVRGVMSSLVDVIDFE